MNKILLFIISVVLFTLIAPFAFLYGLSVKHRSFKGYLLNIAISVDQTGNVTCAPLFDDILIKGEEAYRFGNIDETVSSVLGKNKYRGTLTWLGRAISWVLNKIEKDHVEKSVEMNP